MIKNDCMKIYFLFFLMFLVEEFLILVGVLLIGFFKSFFFLYFERSGVDLYVFGFCFDEEVFILLFLVYWVECFGCFL